MNLLLILVGFFLLTFIGLIVGIVLLIVRKEKWAGIIVSGLSLGIGFYIILGGLNLVTTSLLQSFSNPFSFTSDFGNSDSYSDDYTDNFDDDYIDVKYGQTVTMDDESTVTINKPVIYREKADYDIYSVNMKVKNSGADEITFSSEDVLLYDYADDDYGEEITEKVFSGTIKPGETKELTLFYKVYNFGPYDVEYDNYNWTE
ncbi:DUF4352 domain-containing protein [Listeria ivanovii]|uniref:DUF4352 domain-containing protein n=2 Tax=Listeria ivanovii TaxID=1638 RepID=A0ABS1G6V0_LISIV|nr:DUF4352 domain-containing protein [Listeria ivanovii]EFR96902.1 conserved hypothetical protein [Listeria ivanovii FSL F6-596]AIS59865.1 hypothetical protein JL58_07660 [Listeria ivanovii subsp. londoniensis]AIS62693.1 hypothetical protein JL53_08130 [Listeria ivanovii subsp. londoniensis]MBK1962602.1 DUF4352 domain-containing protein [Listeria ivanovii subsp. londoniensis]MBK1967276.1 DUF4352 domain-containing protein [Listeria ivanovii subsp. londoniensis]